MKMEPFVLLAFFSPLYSIFLPNLRPIPVIRPVVVLSCLPLFYRHFSGCLGLETPNSPFVLSSPENGLFRLPKQHFKGKMANVDAENTLNLGKNRQNDKWARGGGGVCMRENGAICPFGFFPPVLVSSLADLTTENGTICRFGVFVFFYYFFASKLDISPLKRSVFGVQKGPFWGTNGEFGFQNPKTAEMPFKQGKSGLVTGILASNWPKMTTKQGKNTKRTDGAIFTRPPVHVDYVFQSKKNGSHCRAILWRTF